MIFGVKKVVEFVGGTCNCDIWNDNLGRDNIWKMLNNNVKDSNKDNKSNKNDNLGRDKIMRKMLNYIGIRKLLRLLLVLVIMVFEMMI